MRTRARISLTIWTPLDLDIVPPTLEIEVDRAPWVGRSCAGGVAGLLGRGGRGRFEEGMREGPIIVGEGDLGSPKRFRITPKAGRGLGAMRSERERSGIGELRIDSDSSPADGGGVGTGAGTETGSGTGARATRSFKCKTSALTSSLELESAPRKALIMQQIKIPLSSSFSRCSSSSS